MVERRCRLDDRGSIAVLTACVALAMMMVLLVAIPPIVHDLIDRQVAQNAADAAALAGVIGGRSASSEIASVNGAALVDWSFDGQRVTVTVEVDGQRARARATDEP